MRAIKGKIVVTCAVLASFCALKLANAQSFPAVSAVPVASGLSQPLFVTSPPGDYNRLFIVQKTGQVGILNLGTGDLNSTPFLDISARISTDSEQGLVGLAFDPNYSSNGKFYLDFVVPGGVYGSGTTHVSQFQVSSNADIADTSNEKVLITFDHPYENHDGGWIAFSPRSNDDHNLYIASGDGGNANDQGTGHIEPGGNAQNLTTLLGKMLRIHVDSATATVSIPSNNPYFGSSTNRQEIFCYGLRNPFRDSFDRSNGRMMIGDVGQDTREEIDVQQATNLGGGENYEWRLREGFIATPTGSPVVGGNRPAGGIDPIIDYPHSGSGITGQCVIGGYIYRGKQIPTLQGTYVFGDYVAGKIFKLNYDGTTASNFTDVTSNVFSPKPNNFGLTSFGEDANGELYFTDLNNGVVYKITPNTPSVIISSIAKMASGDVVIQGSGVPFKNHTVKATTDLTQQFATIGTVTAGGDGSLPFDDASPGNVRFYQFTYP